MAEWKDIPISDKTPQDLNGNGWEKNENELPMKWATKKIALNEVLEFVTYNCKNSRCKTKKCQCFPLENTDLCNCKSCSNVYTDSDEETAEEDNNYHRFDDGDH